MFNKRGRGPKPSVWKHAVQGAFEEFFAKRSNPLNDAEKVVEPPLAEATGAGLKWLYSGLGIAEPTQVQATIGAPIRSTVLGVTGSLVALENDHDVHPHCHRHCHRHHRS